MTRVDELQKKYPDLPPEFIVKWEILSHGVKDSETIDKVSSWTRGGSYQSRDLDITMKEIADKRSGAKRPGYVMRPKPLYMKNGIGAVIRRHSRTPYEIREESEDQFALHEGEEKVEDIYFPSPKNWGEGLVTSRGTPVPTIVTAQARCFSIQPIRFCEYFIRGERSSDGERTGGGDAGQVCREDSERRPLHARDEDECSPSRQEGPAEAARRRT